MTERPFNRGILVCAISLALAACAANEPAPSDAQRATRAKPTGGMSPVLADAAARAADPNAAVSDRSRIYKGSGVVVKGQEQGGGLPAVTPVQPAGNAVVLNFEAADLRDVIRNILGDILNASYTIDPAVGGQVTIRTSAGIARDALPATLEMLLRMNGAAMVREEGVYKIVPQAAAVRGNVSPQLGNSQRALPPGFSVQIVPLRYVGVREMLRILEPFAKDASAIRGDDTRNLLILAGTEIELKHLMDAVAMFDIDWMSGMSAGVFTLQNSDVKVVVQELDRLLGDRNLSPLTGILRIVPIERMNALLVISPNPAYVEEAKKWIERLDGGGGEGTRFYVYNLQNQRAERIAPLLQQALTGRATQQPTTTTPTLAPGTPAGTIVNPPSFSAQPTSNTPQTPTVDVRPVQPPGSAARAGAGEGVGIARNVQVVADKDQNTILVIATPSEYSLVDQALKKLDVQSRQVMIDVTIAEVTLTDDLTLGIEWVFKGGAPSGRGSGGFFAPNGSVPFNPANPVGSAAAAVGLGLAQGFSYIINNANFPGGVQAVLNLLDQYGNTRVISNPHLAALDNQKATIKSGDRIPINQQTFIGTGTGTTTNAVTTTSQYIDTGVLLQVIPHINAGGLVTLEVQAEVSNPGNPAAAGEAPPIATRSVQTMVAVPSGRTMVMGGLITTTKQNSTNGLPLLDRIPVLGGLFGKQDLKDNRTELVLFITPRVVDTEVDYEGVMNDLRRKMEGLDRVFPAQPSWPAAQPTPSERMERFFAPKADPLPRTVPPGAVTYP